MKNNDHHIIRKFKKIPGNREQSFGATTPRFYVKIYMCLYVLQVVNQSQDKGLFFANLKGYMGKMSFLRPYVPGREIQWMNCKSYCSWADTVAPRQINLGLNVF